MIQQQATTGDSEEGKSDAEETVFTIRAECLQLPMALLWLCS
jgi:hypothetical protein